MDIDIISSIVLAIGLAAACGFRVFLPLFAVSILSHFGFATFGLNESFEWIGSMPAIVAFGGASLLEIVAYYIPYIDNLLDTIAVPLAAVAGTLISMSTMMDLDPLIQWGIALIAGGGLAGLIKGSGATTRAISTTTTGGLANPVVSSVETGAAVAMTGAAIFMPVLAILFICLVFYLLYRVFRKMKEGL